MDAFHAIGVAHGESSCEGDLGYRGGVASIVYIAWLRDPAGNKICALHRSPKLA